MAKPIKLRIKDKIYNIKVSDKWYINNVPGVVKINFNYNDWRYNTVKYKSKAYCSKATFEDITKYSDYLKYSKVSSLTYDENMLAEVAEDNAELIKTYFSQFTIYLKEQNLTVQQIYNFIADIISVGFDDLTGESLIIYENLIAYAESFGISQSLAEFILTWVAQAFMLPYNYNQYSDAPTEYVIFNFMTYQDSTNTYFVLWNLTDLNHCIVYTQNEIEAIIEKPLSEIPGFIEFTATELPNKAELAILKAEENAIININSRTIDDMLISIFKFKFFDFASTTTRTLNRHFKIVSNDVISGVSDSNNHYIDSDIDISTLSNIDISADYYWDNSRTTEYNNTCTVTLWKSDGSSKSLLNYDADPNDMLYTSDHTINLLDEEINKDDTLNINLTIGNTTCLSGDTLITMADGSQKRIDQINKGDKILAYHKGKLVEDEVKFTDALANKERNDVTIYYFDNNTKLTVIKDHRLFNVRTNKYTHLSEFIAGDETIDLHGHKLKLVKKERINKMTNHYTIFTKKYNTYFANNLLAGNIFSNMKTNFIFTVYYYLILRWEMKKYEKNVYKKNGK